MSYKIVRFFRRTGRQTVIKRGLTLEEAQAHCDDPETSSITAVGAEGVKRSKMRGPWFDGYFEEESIQPRKDEA